MKIFLLGLVLALACTGEAKIKLRKHGLPPAGAAKSRATPVMNTIQQNLDHFNVLDDRTWSMRYLSNDEFFKAGSPIFIFLGGEWEISNGYLITGQMYDMAKKTNGMMYYTEHRYYGESFPTEDFTSDNMKWLNVDQALADVAYFILDRKAKVQGLKDSKVVVVGGSYSASMATWMRLKYPHLVDAALSSSAPLVATSDFYRYYEVVGQNILLQSPECYKSIENAVKEIEAEMTTQEGIARVTTLFNTCESVKNTEPHRAYFFKAISEVFAGLVQYAQIGQISRECTKLLNEPGTDIEKLGAYVRDYYSGDCMGDYDEFVDYYSATATSTDMFRQWFYQCCTEYAYWQTTVSLLQPFGRTVSITLFHDICRDLYGEEFTPERISKGIKRTNAMYGGITPDVTKVMTVHGNVDPWHSIGLLQDLNDLAPAIVVNGTAHCADLSSITAGDIPEMRAAKERSQEEILKWILT